MYKNIYINIILVYIYNIISHKNDKHLPKLRNFKIKIYKVIKRNLQRRLP